MTAPTKGCGGRPEDWPDHHVCDDCRPAKCGTCGGSRQRVDPDHECDGGCFDRGCPHIPCPACTPAPAAKGCQALLDSGYGAYRCGEMGCLCGTCAAAQQREIEKLEKESRERFADNHALQDCLEAAEARVKTREEENATLRREVRNNQKRNAKARKVRRELEARVAELEANIKGAVADAIEAAQGDPDA